MTFWMKQYMIFFNLHGKEPQRMKTASDMCAQQRLKSICASETVHHRLSKMRPVKILIRLPEFVNVYNSSYSTINVYRTKSIDVCHRHNIFLNAISFGNLEPILIQYRRSRCPVPGASQTTLLQIKRLNKTESPSPPPRPPLPSPPPPPLFFFALRSQRQP